MIAPAPAATPYDTTKDDDDSSEGGTTTYQATVGYSWTNDNSATVAYGGDQHETADTVHAYLATWSFTGLTVGKEYQVLVTWKPDAANATNSLFEVWDGGVQEAGCGLISSRARRLGGHRRRGLSRRQKPHRMGLVTELSCSVSPA